MNVPNQDKLVYGRVNGADDHPGSESLLPPPEQPQAPPRTPTITPAFPAPQPAAGAAPAPPSSTSSPSPPPPPAQTAAAEEKPAEAPAKPAEVPVKTAEAKPRAGERAAAEHRAAPAPEGSGWLVQVAALRTEAEAKAAWARIQGHDKDLLGGLSLDIRRVDLGARGIYWRLRAGPLDEAGARSLCAKLAKRNQGCIVVRK